MMKIDFSFVLPDAEALYDLYGTEGWNEFLQLPKEVLYKAMERSWRVICAYHQGKLVGTGRVVSDGIINAYVCGLIVLPQYRSKGIGQEMLARLVKECEEAKLHIQLLAEKEKASYYVSHEFEQFAVGMKHKKTHG
jgi:ribosomal protein S18 acetylase RimI-like enzyme